MNPRTYDLSMMMGTAMCACSAWQLAGPAVALGVAGVLVIVLTLLGAVLTMRAAKR